MNTAVETYIKETGTSFPIEYDKPLHTFTSLQVGGKADIFAAPATRRELAEVVKMASELSLPLTILGSGTNTLVTDSGVRGIVLFTGRITQISFQGSKVTAGCGTGVDTVIQECIHRGCGGLEPLFGLPGSIGGAAAGNAGCFGLEIGDVFISAELCSRGGRFITVYQEEAGFSYRKSSLAQDGAVIYAVCCRVQPGDAPGNIAARAQEYRARRVRRGHYTAPSAGSVFKRPLLAQDHPMQGISAGELIEKAGLSGLQCGGAQIAPYHANFIINPDGRATASDILGLIEIIRKKVCEKFAVSLAREIRIIGEL